MFVKTPRVRELGEMLCCGNMYSVNVKGSPILGMGGSNSYSGIAHLNIAFYGEFTSTV